MSWKKKIREYKGRNSEYSLRYKLKAPTQLIKPNLLTPIEYFLFKRPN